MAALSEPPAFSRRAIVLFAMPVFACILVTALVLMLRPEPIRTHPDAIGYVLRQRGIPYESIIATQPWPITLNYDAYGSSVYHYSLVVSVDRADAPPLNGTLECHDDQRNCFLTLRDAGIMNVAAPDTRTERLPVWLKWLEWLERIVWR